MDRIWQWAWDRYGTRYSWALCAISFPILLTYLFWSFVVVAVEGSDRYFEAAGATVFAVLVLSYAMVLRGLGRIRLVEHWAAGHKVERRKALEATYAYARGAIARAAGGTAVWAAFLFVVVGVIAGATGSRLVQYAILGVVVGVSVSLVAVHSFIEATLRPARVAIGGDTGIGDALPRSRPSFAAWSNLSMIAGMFSMAIGSAMLGAVFDRAREEPVLFVVIASALTLGFAVPFNVGTAFSQSLRPIRDLTEGTQRVAAGGLQPTPAGGSG